MTRAIAAFVCLFAVVSSAQEVKLVSSGQRSFEIATGEYRVKYDVEKDKDGWVLITRNGIDSAIGTKLAQGQGLDVTAGRAGEGEIYGWSGENLRKDSVIFRSLEAKETEDAVEITIHSERQWAKFTSTLRAFKKTPGLVHWRVKVAALADRAMSGDSTPDGHFVSTEYKPDWQRPVKHDVVRYAVQRGPHSGLLYFKDVAMKSSVFYFEDLTSMNDLYRLTQTDNPFNYPLPGNPGAVKMGPVEHWFQPASNDGGKTTIPPKKWEAKVEQFDAFGYERPSSMRIPKGAKLTISDTYLYLKPATEETTTQICRTFVDNLATIYPHITKPAQIKTDWRGTVLPRMLKDIQRPANMTNYKGKYHIPRAYVGYEHEDVQLWTVVNLLHPLEAYLKKFPSDAEAKELRDKLDAALPLYWDKEFHWIGNNPAPQKRDMFFTGVYIFIPVEMVADLALLGNRNAREMFMDVRGRYLEMGRKCNYVFADVWLEDFSRQNVLYQMDTTGVYISLMMAYYELSGGKDVEALEAAKAAAGKLEERCLDLSWEVCMTARGVLGCMQLYKATGEERYRDLAYIPLANTLLCAWLWECDYGVGEKTTTFWSFSGCPAAPCSAEFENHRTRMIFREVLKLAGKDLPASVASMMEDGWKRGLTQSRFAMPPLLVEAGAGDFIAADGKKQTNCGKIDHTQMIPLEDSRPGWGTDIEWWQNNAKLGVVGQEIYGAGGPIWYSIWQDEVE